MAILCETCKHFARITKECKLALIKKMQDPNKDVIFCPDYFCNGVQIPDYIRMPHIEKVIFNEPATIVFWSDDTKTVVKCDKDDIFDPEKGLAMSVAKKTLGTNASDSNYYDIFKKYLKEYEQNKKIEQLDKKARNIKVRITISEDDNK